jgi:predicted acetyltransferase
MCREAIRLGRESGAALSALFPFRSDFYGRLGYVLVGELHRYRFATGELPAFAGQEHIAPLRGEERTTLLCDFYRRLLPRTHGLVDRTAPMWKERLEGTEIVKGYFGPNGRLAGYLIAGGKRGRSPDRSMLRVDELLAETGEAYRALLGWLSVQRDQWPTVRYDALPGERFHQLLAHPRTPGSPPARGLWFPSAFLLRGPMVRILDLDAVIRAAGANGESDLVAAARKAFGEETARDATEEAGDEDSDEVGPRSDASREAGASENGRAFVGGAVARIRSCTEAFLAGTLPGQAERLAGWEPVLGLRDFRLLDVF